MPIEGNVVPDLAAPASSKLTVVGAKENLVLWVLAEIPRRQKVADVGTLCAPWRGEDQQALFVGLQKGFDVLDNTLVMLGRLKALVPCPFSE